MTLALWVIAISLIGCFVMLISIYLQGKHMEPILSAQLKGLGETNLLGYEAIVQQLTRLENGRA
jgi:hypothetical protein